MGEAKFIVTLEVTVPDERGYNYVHPVKWAWIQALQNMGIKNGRVEILNISPIRYEGDVEEHAIFYDGADNELREWEESRGQD